MKDVKYGVKEASLNFLNYETCSWFSVNIVLEMWDEGMLFSLLGKSSKSGLKMQEKSRRKGKQSMESKINHNLIIEF